MRRKQIRSGLLGVLLMALLLGGSVHADGEGPLKPLSVEDFVGIHWISDPRLSPDGKLVIFTVTYKSLAKNSIRSNLYLDKVYADEPALRFTLTEAKDFHPRFSPDQKTIAFLSTRSGTPQIWTIPAAGGEATQLTDFPTGISGFAFSPDGKRIAFTADTWPECGADLKCLKKKVEADKKVGGRVVDHIPVRLWNSWRDSRRSHLFVIPADGKGDPIDLTPFDHDVPPLDLGSDHDFVWSPDGKLIAFVMNETVTDAWNTNNDVFIVPSTGGEIKKVSTGEGSDTSPWFSPDGKYLAYLSMERPGFESDKRRLVLYDIAAGTTRVVAPGMDKSIFDFVWAPDSKGVFFYTAELGRRVIYYMGLDGKLKKIYAEGYSRALSITSDGRSLVFLHERSTSPPDIYRIDSPASKPSAPVRLTFFNRQLMEKRALGTLEEFWFEGARGDKVHAFLMKPPYFDPSKKYPALFLLHGGPQSDWADSFHPRWNMQMFASRGMVLVLINFHGSIGYGQEFTDSVSLHWGDYPLEDIMKGVDYVLANYPFVDPERLGAAGASFGGYLANWLMCHTDRFKAYFTHAGSWHLTSKYASTDELWFPEWEFGGTPWEKPELYEKFSPSRFIKEIAKYKTPTLVSHGVNDFRVTFDQGLGLFTLLQRLGVESKFMYFPDEDHFVQKPANVKLFYETFLDWFETHLK